LIVSRRQGLEGLCLRTAEPNDYERIVGVVDDSSSVWWTTHRRCGGRLIVGVVDDRWGRPVRSSLARRLYQWFFDQAAAESRTTVKVITSPRNRGSVAFHEAMGFTAIGPVADYDGTTVDRIVFQLQLSPR
jgi:predicted GNAT superfamily acetyltransferase